MRRDDVHVHREEDEIKEEDEFTGRVQCLLYSLAPTSRLCGIPKPLLQEILLIPQPKRRGKVSIIAFHKLSAFLPSVVSPVKCRLN
jgi:hypothetical protein